MGKYYDFYRNLLLLIITIFTVNVFAQSAKTMYITTVETDNGRTVIDQTTTNSFTERSSTITSFLSELKVKDVENMNVLIKRIKDNAIDDKELFLTRSKAISGLMLRSNTEEVNEGPIVKSVVVGSPADKAGLRKGDILKQVSGQPVKDLGGFMNILCPLTPGDPIVIKIDRDGELMDVSMVLEESIIKYLNPEQMELDYKSISGTEAADYLNNEFVNDDDLYEISLSWGSGDQDRMLVFNLLDVQKPASKNNYALTLNDLSIAPNPTNGRVYISFSMEEMAGSEVIILDALGKEVFKEKISDDHSFYNKMVDLSAHPKGFYFLRVSQNNKMINKKIVVQ